MPPKKQLNNGVEGKQSAPQPKKQAEPKTTEPKQENGTFAFPTFLITFK
jgi:hypothetical protein